VSHHTAEVDMSVASKCHFEQGDACNLSKVQGCLSTTVIVVLANQTSRATPAQSTCTPVAGPV
jgi:hypothetical protein